MSRCTLCGGKLVPGGKCTECGLDNSKNDKKYRLNQHNEKGVHLHRGDCEDNLNGESGRQSRQDREQTGARTYDKSSARSQSAKTVEMARMEKKKAQQRRETGTVRKKKKGSCLGWIVLILALIGGLGEQADEIFYEIETFFESTFSGAIPEPEPVGVWEVAVEDEIVWTPQSEQVTVVDWNRDVDLFYTASLGPGIYTGGYDIPAGVYQLDCQEGSTYVYWWNPKSQGGGSAMMFSEAEQLDYEEVVGEVCEYSRYSEMFELEEGGILYVEVAAGLTISGHRNDMRDLEERKAQGLSGAVVLDGASGTAFVAGEHFEPGTYDVIVEGEYGAFMDIDRNGSAYYISLSAGESFLRFPFSEGTKIELDLFGDDTSVRLVPSY